MAQITHLTKIGNSFGVILNKKLLMEAGITGSEKINIMINQGSIVITAVKKEIEVNLDRSTWGAQFKKAFKVHGSPEKSVWPESVSGKADKEWTW